jgi:GNAT superfamily N-acetyltransferase
MTTTLRPTEPERTGPGGVRSRRFTVCVNGRPVGEIAVATSTRFAENGVVSSVRIDEPDRRRGRATVAVLAAEEVLRGWGCRRAEAVVPQDTPGSAAAHRLATALGYVDRNRTMRKVLSGGSGDSGAFGESGGPGGALPEGLRLRRLEDAEFPAWRDRSRRGYADIWAALGIPRERADAVSDTDLTAMLPDGAATAGGTRLRVLEHEGRPVGTLWLGLLPDDPGDGAGGGSVPEGYVYEVEVDERFRGRGFGRALMLAAEDEARAAGWRALGLNVYAANGPAVRLYTSLGYRTLSTTVHKPLL